MSASGSATLLAALWPDRCKVLVSASGYLIGSRPANSMPLSPQAFAQAMVDVDAY